MRIVSSFCAVLALFSCFGITTGAAHAESYQLFNLGGDDVALVGINAAGTVLLHQMVGCNGANDPNFCYEEFSGGGLVYRDDVAPIDFMAENGTACAPAAGLVQLGKSVCNGGYEVTGGSLANRHGVWESYPGSTSPGDLIYSGSADVLYLNAKGDFLVDDGIHDNVYQVVVAQTPEPSSLLLLASGALALGVVFRQRSLRTVRV